MVVLFGGVLLVSTLELPPTLLHAEDATPSKGGAA